MMRKHRFVPLNEVPEDSPDKWKNIEECNYCYDGPEWRKVKSVGVKEHQGKIHRYFGICGNHAEVQNLSTEWQEF